ncbi:hypothetical protein JJL45_13040 [Tamlana sp. s12]|uniref:hypothetical protein n=1 Tax=Tamlana sp. s12 TaxID=1630406 RepID=UPI000801BE55|nr:hypothetical protein [Tamlana sp. s12]OBQ56531.1 hypothetical protein VQ01_04060 [Tamlana sp. s12]QQY81836.1 hypothetical protein JJL45_13040 [Tamlana sp. s12]
MVKPRVLGVFIALVYSLFIYLQIKDNDVVANYLEALLVPLVALGYLIFEKKKTVYFSLFILLYAVSDLLDFIVDYINYDVYYYVGNILYMFGYSFLMLEILKSTDFNYLKKRFKIHLVVLFGLSVYLIYVLQDIVSPFVEFTNKYYIEIVYNALLVALLSLALLNYIHKENKKALFLFLGVILIVFSEFIWVADNYIVKKNLLTIISSTLALGAFFCFYKQVQYSVEEGEESRVALDNEF